MSDSRPSREKFELASHVPGLKSSASAATCLCRHLRSAGQRGVLMEPHTFFDRRSSSSNSISRLSCVSAHGLHQNDRQKSLVSLPRMPYRSRSFVRRATLTQVSHRRTNTRHRRSFTYLVNPSKPGHDGMEAVLLAGLAIVALPGLGVGDALLGEVLVALLVAPKHNAGAPPRRAD